MPPFAQTKMILWTFAAVLVMGFGVAASVLNPPASVVLKHVKTQEQIQASLVETPDRSPASQAPQFSALAIDDKGQQAIDFTLPCDGALSRFASGVVQVRISGHLCDKPGARPARAISSSEIRNTTNGFSATVFFPKSDSFTTDYITLSPGKNQIRILHQLKAGGRVERDFVIERL